MVMRSSGPSGPAGIDPSAGHVRVEFELPRDALRALLPPPIAVSQRTSLQILGIPSRQYLELARAGAFPSARLGKLRIARVADVVAAIPMTVTPPEKEPTPMPLDPVEAAMVAAGGRVGLKSRGTP